MIKIDHSRYSDLNAAEKLNCDLSRLALADYLRSNAGLPVKNPRHADLIREWHRSDMDLEKLAREISPANRSVNSSDFAAAMSIALTEIVQDVWPDLSKRLDPFCRIHEVDNFKPQALAQITFPELSEVGEDFEPRYSAPVISATATGQLKSYESALTISRQLWATHGGALSRATVDYGYQAHRLELRLLSELLTSNPVLSDGDTLFNADNTTGPGGQSLSGLDSALNYFCTGGPSAAMVGPMALSPSALLVGNSVATWRSVLTECGFNFPVIASPWIPAGSWFVFSDPNEHASIVRLREINGSRSPSVGWVNIDSSGRKGFFASVDLGFAAVSRHGIFRGGI